MGDFFAGLLTVLLFIGLVVLLSVIGSLPVYLLWNYVVVALAPTTHVITLFQAWLISVFISFMINLLKK
jgi:hypothetical protein